MSDKYKKGTLTDKKQDGKKLDALIEFCEINTDAYEKHRNIQGMNDHDFTRYWNERDE